MAKQRSLSHKGRSHAKTKLITISQILYVPYGERFSFVLSESCFYPIRLRFEKLPNNRVINNLIHYYWPLMREGNVFILSVCLSVQAITFECLDIETSFLVWWDIFTIPRSILSTKVIG